MKRSVTIKILGKETRKRFFFGTEYIVIAEVEGSVGNKAVPIPVPIGQYYQMQVNNRYNVFMYQHSDSKWYFQPESEDE